jgi:nucleotide-binding universal stress UspA family protein
MNSPTLIPVDGSTLSDGILEPLKPLVRQRGGEIVLLRVVPELGTAPDQSEEVDLATEHLNALASQLRTQGFTVEAQVLRGEPADRILQAATDSKAGLIGMSTHGRSGVSRLVRGSVAERVLRASPTPVFLCNPDGLKDAATRFKRILVPLDGSALSDGILPWVEELASTYGSQVTLFRVKPFVYSSMPSPVLAGELWSEAAARASLEPQRQRLEAAGIEVSVRAAYGIESSEILAVAAEVDLVAMTTHGRSGPSRWWFGSVAESVIRHCSCPLLVLRSRE